MHTISIRLYFIIFLTIFSQNLFAIPLNQLEKIGYSTLPGNRVQVNLDFSNQANEPISFAMDNPARIVLDFPNVTANLTKKTQIIGIGAVEKASAVEANNRTRVVIKLVRNAPFSIEVVDNRVLILVDNITQQASAVKAMTSPLSSAVVQSKASRVKSHRGPSIENVDFRRISEGTGQVIITLSDPSINVSMNKKGEEIILDFPNTYLPEKLNRRLDVTDFSTPVNSINTRPFGNNVQMVILAEGNYDYASVQSQNVYTVEVKKLTPEEEKKLEKKKPTYSGPKISFDFQNIDVRTVLKLLTNLQGADFYNMIIPKDVSGNVTLRLKNVPWDQALEIVLESHDLGMERVGNIIMIDKKANISARKERELKSQQKIKALEPLQTEFIKIKYSKASDINALLQSKGSEAHSFLSPGRGNVSVDKRTNTLIIQDTAQKISEIRGLIESLDTPVRQVLIESRVVIATDDFSRDLGVKFGYSANKDLGGGYGAVVGGKVEGDTIFSGNTAFGTGTENFLVSFPGGVTDVGGAALGLAIGKIGTYLLQLELAALQSEGRGEIISSPRVITSDQNQATIKSGQEFAFASSAGSGAGAVATTEFKEAVLELTVTPQITPDDRIIMDLKVTKDDPIAGGALSTREIETQVLVDNGETVVLGGVYEQRVSEEVIRVPFFSDLPLVGNLFKRRNNLDAKTELLLFVTPKILKDT